MIVAPTSRTPAATASRASTGGSRRPAPDRNTTPTTITTAAPRPVSAGQNPEPCADQRDRRRPFAGRQPVRDRHDRGDDRSHRCDDPHPAEREALVEPAQRDDVQRACRRAETEVPTVGLAGERERGDDRAGDGDDLGDAQHAQRVRAPRRHPAEEVAGAEAGGDREPEQDGHERRSLRTRCDGDSGGYLAAHDE
jgi:hypothetical protein